MQDRAQELERQQQETQAAFEAKLRQVEEETTAAAHRAAETHSFQVQVLGICSQWSPCWILRTCCGVVGSGIYCTFEYRAA
jgi:hypothetical protein